jgi:hypothetical protein
MIPITWAWARASQAWSKKSAASLRGTVPSRRAWFSSYFMQGDLAEILFYDQALSESDRGAANTYLKSKYALP